MNDTSQDHRLSRRAFTSGIIAGAALSRSAWAGHALTAESNPSGYAYVGSPQALHVFKIHAGTWSRVQDLAADQPIHLELHPSLPILYVVHHVDRWHHLPRGAVSVYAIEDGRLRPLQTQPLSLSATFPTHAAISPDGRSLAVAAQHGGIYNLLRIAPNGRLESITAIYKDFGLTIDRPARPRCVAWHPDGITLLTADSGNAHLSAFSTDESGMERLHHHQVPGDGTSHLAISREGNRIYALDARDGSILVQTFDPLTKQFTSPSSTLVEANGPSVMATHPDSDFIVTIGSAPGAATLTSLRIDPQSGPPDRVDHSRLSEGQSAIAFADHGRRLCGVAATSGAITEWRFDPSNGRFSQPLQVARLEGACSLAVALEDRQSL